MRLDSLRVELRPRSPWEAVELGTALVRGNARAIWLPWLWLSLPVFALVNAAAWAVDAVWAAWLAMWWLKPAFDRIPLFVVSRAVFGDTPGVRATLAAQRTWGWRAMLGYLTWRRIGLVRALTLPVDLLEDAPPARKRERRRVLGDAVRGHAVQLTFACLCFTLALAVSCVLLVFLFVPDQLLGESARALWALVKDAPPLWAQAAGNGVLWLATSVIEPFYVGAGFGLYLNRRTQIEAWDVEIAFRRLRARLAAGTATALVACALAVGALALVAGPSAHAQTVPQATTDKSAKRGRTVAAEEDATADRVFGRARADARPFARSVERAFEDPLLEPTRTETRWEPRRRDVPSRFTGLDWLGDLFGFVGEFGLWLLLGALLVVLALTAKRWWPWLRGIEIARIPESAVDVVPSDLPQRLPEDIVAAARAFWREGRPRRALALLYRASVEAMSRRADVALVPGATEAECLRASRRMPDPADRDAFARIVRVWQYAAYAQRLPGMDEFEALLGELAQRFGWRSHGADAPLTPGAGAA